MSSEPKLDDDVALVRDFTRIYTERIGALNQNIYDTAFSLTETRVVYEIHQAVSTTARDLCLSLGLDGGYLSRILHRLEEQEIVVKKASVSDARRREISLTQKGREAYFEWAEKTNVRIRAMLDGLIEHERAQLLKALRAAADTLAGSRRRKNFTLRPHRTGDMGLIIHSHAVQFAKDYGWNHEFEAFVAGMTGEFIRHFNPRYDLCCVAEMDGDVVGSVFVVKAQDDRVVKAAEENAGELRLLFVAPRARGLGIGRELLDEALLFSGSAGYKKVSMMTQSVAAGGAKVLTQAGFSIASETQNHCYGKDLIAQMWEKRL